MQKKNYIKSKITLSYVYIFYNIQNYHCYNFYDILKEITFDQEFFNKSLNFKLSCLKDKNTKKYNVIELIFTVVYLNC